MSIKTRYGVLDSVIQTYHDNNHLPRVISYKAKETMDAPAFYCPYVPLTYYGVLFEEPSHVDSKHWPIVGVDLNPEYHV